MSHVRPAIPKGLGSTRREPADDKPRVTLGVFIVLALQAFALGITQTWLLPHAGKASQASTGVIVAAVGILFVVLAGLLVALVRRKWWAWLFFALLYGSGLVKDLVKLGNPIEIGLDSIRVAVLLSPSMCRYIGVRYSPARLWRQLAGTPRR